MLLAVAVAAMLTGCSPGGAGRAGTGEAPSTSATPTTSQRPAGTPAATIEKLLVFVVENHSLDQMRDEMPYTSALATRYGYADNYVGVAHPSLPNYLAIAGGDTFGVHDDGPPWLHRLSGPTVFGEAAGSGSTSKVYVEAMSSPCQRRSSGTYAVKHNPWAYFGDERAQCQRGDVPLDALTHDVASGSLPAVGMVVPDLCDDAHDCSLAYADAWMRRHVGAVLAGPDWASGHLAVVITADEDDGNHGNNVLTVVMNPALSTAVVHTRLDHFALSRSFAEVAGVPPLGRAASAPSLLGSFGLRAG